MNNDRFKQRMAELEQERDKFISKLSPEGQQEYKQKEKEFSRFSGLNKAEFISGKKNLPKK